ncbi:MAG TPA: AzlC family ABC transporter permease [Steroidobacteraceae bacterium]|nr:AzlC family ABC transporter permease [Steroidobacteraceae bacterium]
MRTAPFYRDPAWRLEFGRGLRASVPAAPGVLAWGIVTGVAMVKSGLTVPWAIAISLLVYAGSAQLAALPLIAAGQAVWIIGLVAFVTNLRFVIYSASLRRWFEAYSRPRRVLLGYFTGDFTFAMFMQRAAREGEFPYRDAWFLGTCALNWLMWQVASIVGIVAATAIPPQWGLQFAGTLALLALAIPPCLQRPGLAGALVAAPVAVLARGLPFGLGLVAGILAGIAAAVAVDAALTRRKATAEPERG